MRKSILTILLIFTLASAFSQEIKSKNITGTVAWFDSTKGIGFIKTNEGNEIFVNYINLPLINGRLIILQPKQKILFDISEKKTYPEAINLKIIKL